jgi:oligopeptide transport system substrate-binding protein
MAVRLERAKALLAAAGYGPDHRLALTMSYSTSESTRQIMVALRAMWQPLGVDLDLQNSEWQVFVQGVNRRDYDIGFIGEDFSYDDAEHFLDIFRSDAGALNLQSYANPRFDELLRQGSTSLDLGERRRLLEQAEAVVLADYPVIPLEMSVTNRIVNPKLQGMDLRLFNWPSRYLYFQE